MTVFEVGVVNMLDRHKYTRGLVVKEFIIFRI
jgi:hypothetical protein